MDTHIIRFAKMDGRKKPVAIADWPIYDVSDIKSIAPGAREYS